MRTGDDTTVRGVDCSNRQFVGQQRLQFVLRQGHRHHVTAGQALHQPAANRQQRQCVFERKDAGETGRHEFADAVTDHFCRAHAPGDPQLGECVFDDKNCQLGNERLPDVLGGLFSGVRIREHHFANVRLQPGFQQLGALVDRIAKHRFAVVKLSPHVRALRTLAGKHEGDGPVMAA